MKKLSLALSAAALLAVGVSAGEINFKKLEISPVATYNVPEGNLDLINKVGYGLRVGYMFDVLGLELGYEHANGKYKKGGVNPNHTRVDVDRSYVNAILPFGLTDRLDLYGLVGVGYESFKNNLFDNKDGMFGHYGAGLKYKVYKSFGLRAEVRDQIKFRHADHHLITTLGVVFNFGNEEEAPAPVVVAPAPTPAPAPVVVERPKPKACYDLELVKVHFGFDKSNVAAKYIPEIQRLARLINEEPAYFANVRGYTDSVGTTAYNAKLSERRATAVKNELVKAGVSADRINPTWYGEEDAVADNGTKEGRAQNRRVELKIICQ